MLLGVATFKPHFALVPFVWFLLSGNWRVVTTAAAVSALMAAPAAVMLGPVESIADWMAAARAYESGEIGENSPGFYVVMGVPSVLAAIGLPIPGAGPSILLLGGVALTIAFWLVRRAFVEHDALPILLAAQFSLLYGKYVDLAMLAPLLGALLVYAGPFREGGRRKWVIALAGAALLFIPAVIFIRLDARPLNHYRSFVVLAGLVWLVLLSMRNRSRLIGDLARGA